MIDFIAKHSIFNGIYKFYSHSKFINYEQAS